MMRFVVLMLAVACATPEPTTAQTPAAAEQGQREDVDISALVDARAAGAALLDVRTAEEFASGHVPGAINIPLQELKPDDPRLAAFTDEPLYLICQSGRRSDLAADQLVAAGFHVVNVQGGTAAWKSAGQPVE